ncbi:TraL conjugative transposon family protein [Bacteroides sp.]|uniref:TraL conjugative transposon family protein n=1 Tax=Bacteroides sp. TaxID=29523 RepID=UPI001B679D99|nr:TraL conjugative transposon family protein [Bacteroides sp.]MBP6065854.1 DUF3989 domain-containing protein [Bacteroides sp.]MBP6067766.1 DUF3989 domain-containing protein [Bacteroides sp.]MBP6937522.1 DUF3989 domain-containing protein [Bacteroides sp.]MBP8623069.1 DUF3989 domain-containing protein [Bacteroides sp.]MBP9507131.1 DUF3989 domain-containing protein [Bacteroides sp.]
MINQTFTHLQNWADDELCCLSVKTRLIVILVFFIICSGLFISLAVSLAYRIGEAEGKNNIKKEIIKQLNLQQNDSIYIAINKAIDDKSLFYE